MTVNAVTARQRGGSRTAANINFRPRSASITPLRPTVVRPTRIPQAVSLKGLVKPAQRIGLKRLARLLAPELALALPIATELGTKFYRNYVEPGSFPGFAAIDSAFLPDAQGAYPGIVPGNYTLNGFGQVPNNTGTFHLHVDQSDGSAIFGFRYWGHYDPATNPFTGSNPADDWDQQTLPFPETLPMNAPRKLPDLAEHVSPSLEPVLNNISITFSAPAGRKGVDVTIKENEPSVRDRGTKNSPSTPFVFQVIRKVIGSVTETLDFIQALAEASDYHPDSMIIPDDIVGETNKKLWWLFAAGGINHVDFNELATKVIENEIEDRIYATAGKLSKYAAQHLDLTVGPQTGGANRRKHTRTL